MIWMKCKRVEPLGLPFRLQSFRLNTQVTHASVKVTSVNAHLLSGFGDVAVKFREFVLNELTLISVGRVFECWESGNSMRAWCR